MDASWQSILTKRGPLEKGMANHFSILAFRTPGRVGKGKKIGHLKMNSPGRWVPNGEQWKINSSKNEETEPKQKQHSVVVGLVKEVKSNAIKNNTA